MLARKVGCFMLVSILFLSVAGCDDLSKYDLSGQIETELKTDGSTYRKIYEFADRGEDLSELKPEAKPSSEATIDLFRQIFSSGKIYNFDLSNLYILLEFEEDARIGEGNYTFRVDFVDNPPHRFNYLQVFRDQSVEVPLRILQDDTKTGSEKVNLYIDGNEAHHRGYGLASFIEPVSNREYLVDVKYDIKCTPKQDEEVDIDGYETPSSIRISIEAKIGNPRYLAGTLALSEKAAIEAQVLDWDLDGVFTNNDRVRIDEEIFPLNESFKIGKGKREKTYFITLEPRDDVEEKYVLTIERRDE